MGMLWTLDVHEALTSAFVDGLCSEAGLCQDSFSALVAAFLQFRAMQLASSGLSPCSQPELPGLELPGNMLPAELQAHVVKGVCAFLSFAAWLAAAFWPLSEMEQTRLACLDQGEPTSVTAAAAILRLPAITSIQDP